MTCTIVRWADVPELDRPEDVSPGTVKEMIFTCDGPGCAASPTDDEIILAGGLTKMGWECPGGRHYCPEHRVTPVKAIQAITAERRRQIEIEGFTPEHNAQYRADELSRAAACYALGYCPPGVWPWTAEWWKPTTPERNLEKAGALIASEMERLAGEKNGR